MRKIRIAAAVFFFAAYCLLFLGVLEIIPHAADLLPKLQIMPGLLKLAAVLSASSLIAFLMLAMTVVFGRWYCSVLCPFGVLQDFFIFLRRTVARRRRFRFRKGSFHLHLAVFAVSILALIAGVATLLLCLEPYSVFGRITVNLVRPAVTPAVNAASYVLNHAGITSLNPMKQYDPGWPALVHSTSFLCLIGVIAFLRGRLFCNLLCPTGALLRLCAKAPLFRFRIDSDACTRCGKCESLCRAECIDAKNARIDASRCVSCADCASVCHHGAVRYSFPGKRKDPIEQISESGKRTRADFLKAVAGAAVMLPAAASKPVSAAVCSGFLPFKRKEPVMPPGAGTRKLFTGRCTACNLCVEACPNQIIRPSTLEYGAASFLQPKLDYDKGYCLYECTRCTEVCPTGALIRLKQQEKARTQIGKAVLLKERCVVYRKELACTACTEHCPTKAVDSFPYKNGLFAPEVEADACVGCGACEHACPVSPKAIYVEGNVIQTIAGKKTKFLPKEGKTPAQKGDEEEFPF